jgi:hypothetical protein
MAYYANEATRLGMDDEQEELRQSGTVLCGVPEGFATVLEADGALDEVSAVLAVVQSRKCRRTRYSLLSSH